ncbi:auxin-responsive protein SAUR68-like [Telopea speciosissima]|uniref:auxin-responsive protein SAUR68-like n=1 Tax=Telopea speciosissima TaxID=54955 RepID=UPI001CC3C953|nr:auxin-responsive protein SAUR68-like [Telopea speciosissima]
MINPMNLIALAKKWRTVASIGRRRILAPTGQETNKGHFVVYTTDKKRFVVPLTYLNSNIFRELFRVSEEEFGLPTDGPITLPCDASFLDKVVSLVAAQAPQRDLENTLLSSMAVGGHLCSGSSSSGITQGPTQILLRGF